MGIVLDLIIIAIFAISVFLGYKRGLINVAFNMFAFIIALILTIILYNPITNFVIENTQIDEFVKSTIIENELVKLPENNSDESNNESSDIINKYVQKYITDTANNAIDESIGVIADKIVGILVAICLFLVIRILLILTKFIINGIANLPIIKQFNELGGLIYGILSGLIIIYIILAILFFVISLNNTGFIAQALNSSILSKFLSSHNLILNLIL